MSTRNEPMDPALLAALQEAVAPGDVLSTISEGKPNWIVDISAVGVRVETEKSKDEGSGPQLVPAWMLNLGWHHLQRTDSVTNKHLLTAHNVRRSSAVASLLAALPQVEVLSTRPIVLRRR